MLHELLLALGGYPGSIFVKGAKNKIQVVEPLPFLHQSEASLLNRLCQLATFHQQFITFIKQHGSPPGLCKGSSAGQHGLYLCMLCQGLQDVLQPYRDNLVQLESAVIQDPKLTASYIQTKLEKYHSLFSALASVLDQIESQQAHGCHILDILYKSTACGIPAVETALHRLLYMCHGVLYKQLSAWMLHGILLDRHQEFFVYHAQVSPATSTLQIDDDELGLGGVTGRQQQQMLQQQEDLPVTPTRRQFEINGEMLPCYIPSRVAEKILFVGESAQMFETENPPHKHKHRGSILKQREDGFAKELHHLSEQPHFSLTAFEEVIDNIRTSVAEQLWQLVVVDSELLNHLRTLKDFFLLGRGELFLAFIDQAQSLLRLAPTQMTEHNVNQSFQQAARNVLLEDETLLQKFTLTLNLSPKQQQQPGKEPDPKHKGSGDSAAASTVAMETGWNQLGMKYKVDWPVHVILTSNVLDRYNSMFGFLLYVKRIQLELQQCWAQQMYGKKTASPRELYSSKWWLRNHMAFLVDNLQYYLQVDVIESQFSILEEKIQTTRDFEAIKLAHENFLTCLLSQTFLLMKPVHHCLSEILELCHTFCALLSQADTVLLQQESSQLDAITKSFQRQSNLLFKILSSVRSHQASPHLAQLLLRIDYNRYLTMAGGQLGSCELTQTRSDVRPSSSRY